MLNSLRKRWRLLWNQTAPRNPEKHFAARSGDFADVMTDQMIPAVPPPDDYVECRIGERIVMRTGYSEAVTYLGIDNTMMEAEILPDGVQFYHEFRTFSIPVLYAEAGVVELNGRLFYKNK